MNILVIGGAGYIGSHVVKALMAKGHAVMKSDFPHTASQFRPRNK